AGRSRSSRRRRRRRRVSLRQRGRLSTTWAAWGSYPDAGDFGDPDDTHYTEGVYVGYRYLDSVGKEPIFPFGHGLGY
ncbi:putative beta-glucosidase, partial [human gut metagenome]